MNATELTASLVGMLFSLLLFAGLYVWTALALSAVFRKSGVEAWHAWVPLLNWANVLQLGGFSPWFVLLSLVPVLNIAFVVVWVLALYRVNNAFGLGIGMTVLGVLLFPVWATVVGWGSARWVGRETDASSRAGLGAGGGVRRSGEQAPTLPPLPSFPSAAATGTAASAASPSGFAPAPGFGAPGGQSPAQAYAPTQGTTPPPAQGFAPPPAYTPAPAPGASGPVAAPTEPVARPVAPPAAPFVPEVPAPAGPYSPATAAGSAASDETLAGVVPPAGGWAPPPLPSRRAAAAARAEAEPPAEDSDPWQGFALDSTDLSGEVTGAFPGAPAPVSAVPPAPVSDVPVAPVSVAPVSDVPAAPARADQEPAPEPSGADLGITRPPFTRVPAGEASSDDREPWAPARSPMADADAFPEASGPVSAVVGAPDAGAPRSARSSVSAFHARPEIPDEDDALDHTIIARRKRTDWTLVPPTGGPVALTSDVVILGRRPTSDPAFPGAQLVPIQDGTVSKTHARLRLRDDKWYVTDLDSTNGVLFATVMGTEVEVTPGEEVEAGDRFLLGDAEVRLQRSDG